MPEATPPADLDLDQVRRDHDALAEYDAYLWYDVALQTYDGQDAGHVDMAIVRDLAMLEDPTSITFKLFGTRAIERVTEYGANLAREIGALRDATNE